MLTKHILIEGKVQGVGFRNFTFRMASQKLVFGWVRNLNDGRVEVLAQADADKMENFVQALRTGPKSGRVDGLTEKSIHTSESYNQFVVKGDGEKEWSEF